jgi:hypothetical protein
MESPRDLRLTDAMAIKFPHRADGIRPPTTQGRRGGSHGQRRHADERQREFQNQIRAGISARVELRQVNAGKVTTTAALNHAGVVAPQEESRPPRPVANRVSAGRPTRKKWPSYPLCVEHAPLAHGEDKPDMSRADFTWCRTAIEWGWSPQATARRLLELSSKAKENGESYAVLTATRAAESVERQPYRLKPSSRPA